MSDDVMTCVRCGQPMRVSYMGNITKCPCAGDLATAVAGPATPDTERAARLARQQEGRTRQIVIEELHRQFGRVALSHGCVCPVGAEKTCSGPLCPRRSLPAGSCSGAGAGA